MCVCLCVAPQTARPRPNGELGVADDARWLAGLGDTLMMYVCLWVATWPPLLKSFSLTQ